MNVFDCMCGDVLRVVVLRALCDIFKSFQHAAIKADRPTFQIIRSAYLTTIGLR